MYGVPAGGVVAVKSYTVAARRWRHGWELHIDGVGVTQSHGLGDAEAMVRDYIALEFDVPEDSFAVTITPEIGEGLDEDVRETRAEVQRAAEIQKAAAERARSVARRLKAKGLTGQDVARILGVSPQRVSQLLASKTATSRAAGRKTTAATTAKKATAKTTAKKAAARQKAAKKAAAKPTSARAHQRLTT
jgi:predicted transcriptional regulator